MKFKIINFITGFILGILITTGILISPKLSIQNQNKPIKEDVSVSVPTELPKDNNSDVELPRNLSEVLL
ncbi:hypothetical protein [Candidatus Ruminimicrobiellum ovillum]|uniref:hypothetical protein n=1 Tax=Candidatus Ruminimicrobiellum ovillum TaxID=1947927 RepID=UPI003559E1C9